MVKLLSNKSEEVESHSALGKTATQASHEASIHMVPELTIGTTGLAQALVVASLHLDVTSYLSRTKGVLKALAFDGSWYDYVFCGDVLL